MRKKPAGARGIDGPVAERRRRGRELLPILVQVQAGPPIFLHALGPAIKVASCGACFKSMDVIPALTLGDDLARAPKRPPYDIDCKLLVTGMSDNKTSGLSGPKTAIGAAGPPVPR